VIRLIVDANCMSHVFGESQSADYQPVGVAIAGRRPTAIAILGGYLVIELQQSNKIWNRILELERAGRAHRLRRQTVDDETAAVEQTLCIRSDDPHILALARLSGCRVLVSNDKNLIADFKNIGIVPPPRGAVYKNRSHSHLLGLDRKSVKRSQTAKKSGRRRSC
jgi:hypothetical protein